MTASKTKKQTILTGIDLSSVGPSPTENTRIPSDRYELTKVEYTVRCGCGIRSVIAHVDDGGRYRSLAWILVLTTSRGNLDSKNPTVRRRIHRFRWEGFNRAYVTPHPTTPAAPPAHKSRAQFVSIPSASTSSMRSARPVFISPGQPLEMAS